MEPGRKRLEGKLSKKVGTTRRNEGEEGEERPSRSLKKSPCFLRRRGRIPKTFKRVMTAKGERPRGMS